ncbi:MAG: sugar ABC transporter permease [Hyphomicrobiales bacterium]|nr:sugar ABC transporter permease [Hyphomicrobiales bacterium]MCP5374386.1 sugar ABC transporter permease [Hyphomicrobiales bacterium]
MESRRRAAVLFLAPVALVLAAVGGWPLAKTVWFGFTDADLANLNSYAFIGFENYYTVIDGVAVGLLADPEWWRAVANTVVFTVASVALETVLGLAVALVLNQPFPGRGLVRAAVLVPWAIPTIVSARLWAWMLHDQFGMVNDLLLAAGVLSQPVAWLAEPHLAMAAVVLVDVWKTTPFMALLLLAALQMLPRECYEAARVDGASAMRRFFTLTLPLIRPALVVAVVFRCLDALKVFDVIYVLTANNPRTMSMSIYARQALVEFQEVGYGSAASTLLFLVVALFITAYLMLNRGRRGVGAAT